MSEEKVERQKKAAKRTRGNFVGVYELVTIGQLLDEAEDGKRTHSDTVFVQVVSENAACKNIAEAKKEAKECGFIGTFVALRRTGDVFQRVIKQVASFVTPKNVEGFNEVAVSKEESDA